MENCQKMTVEIDILFVEMKAKSALFDILAFMKSINQFEKECKIFCRSGNESHEEQYKRLVEIIKDKVDLIVDINKQKDLDIPPDVNGAENRLLHCLKILRKSALNNLLVFLKDLDPFMEDCRNCCKSENEVQRLKYFRLLQVITDKLNVINDIKKQNDLEIPPEVNTAKNLLFHCMYLLHKRQK